MQLLLKILRRMANDVDPDQTAPSEQSNLGLYRLPLSFCWKFGIRNYRTLTVLCKFRISVVAICHFVHFIAAVVYIIKYHTDIYLCSLCFQSLS